MSKYWNHKNRYKLLIISRRKWVYTSLVHARESHKTSFFSWQKIISTAKSQLGICYQFMNSTIDFTNWEDNCQNLKATSMFHLINWFSLLNCTTLWMELLTSCSSPMTITKTLLQRSNWWKWLPSMVKTYVFYDMKKSHLFFATPVEYDHFGYANPEQNYLTAQ